MTLTINPTVPSRGAWYYAYSSGAKSSGYFSASCRVSVDASGNKSSVMTKSSGSKTLDDYLVKTAGEYFNGPRSVTVTILISCKVVAASDSHCKNQVAVAVMRPPLTLIKQEHALNRAADRREPALFDENGHVVAAEMAQSTGSNILDGNTVNFARICWCSSGGEKVTHDDSCCFTNYVEDVSADISPRNPWLEFSVKVKIPAARSQGITS